MPVTVSPLHNPIPVYIAPLCLFLLQIFQFVGGLNSFLKKLEHGCLWSAGVQLASGSGRRPQWVNGGTFGGWERWICEGERSVPMTPARCQEEALAEAWE